MEISVLKYFLMVSREENITKAANLLHITQSTLSRQLRQLEEELDEKFFERRRNAIKNKSLRNILSETMASFREKYPLFTYEIYSGNADIIKGK